MAAGLGGCGRALLIRPVPTSRLIPPLREASQLRATRPPTASKQFPDLKRIRHNVDVYRKNCVHRNYQAHEDLPTEIATLTESSRLLSTEISQFSRKINELERVIAKANTSADGQDISGEDIAATTRQAGALRAELKKLDTKKTSLDSNAHDLALSLPNLTSSETPLDGNPRLISYIKYDPEEKIAVDTPTSHVDIGNALSIIDFDSASTSTGWGFYFLVNEGALLEQALVQYALWVALRRGWRAVSPPSVVYSYLADACGFQPRDRNDEHQIWQIEQAEKDLAKPRRSLTATAEIPLAAMYAGRDIAEEALPLKLIGSSRCYRAEAGARGVDTKGLYRVHEFTKVEMFAWTNSAADSEDTEHSTPVLDEMLSIQTEILSSLGLPCRVLEMPSSDLGASAYRKIDIEALFPSRITRGEGWGEVTSLSLCTDYQSRRLGTRILQKSGKKGKFPHTVNGTAVAIPRVLAAILEHGWRPQEQCVVIPEVLRSFMGGQDVIRAKSKS